MLRSVFSKGMEALLIEFLVAGERSGRLGLAPLPSAGDVIRFFDGKP